ncbi:C6 transcription factor, partial [Fusarium denticulatum]
YGVVVMRETKLDDASYISLARRFGELDDVKPYNKAGRVHRLAYNELFDIGNMEHDGSIVDPSSPRAQANRGNSLFHVDLSFNPCQAGYSLLLSHELPPRGTGKPADYPIGRHHLAQKHERSGHINLYLAKYIHHIEGFSIEESQKLFNKLFDYATQDNESLDAITVSQQAPDYPSDAAMQEYAADEPPEPLRMALRNPSDALQILAYSQDDSPASTRSLSIVYSDATGRLAPQATPPAYSTTHGNRPTPSFILDNYELVQRGLLHPSILPELLHIFAKNYHPYCPIVPEYFLGSSALERIQKSDYFLLAIILTIASRDSPNHVLVHRYCWDHTQHLLLQVLLAHPWSHTPRTVEGLILLSEWLPHIQANRATAETHKTLPSEDRTAWSLVGLAVRLGYLLRLDTAAFRNVIDDKSKEQEERKRLVQISVRLGHSFWSHGPALSSHFTEKDFPSLKSTSGVNDQSYASVLEATLELTQLIYNAHQILYPSTDKTLTMIQNGDYPIYLDDFDRSITTWHAKWKDVQAPINVKTSLMLTYEYTRLYVNAFSFQAVVIRKSIPCSSSQPGNRHPHPDQFGHGITSLPDGRYVFDATQAAKNLLVLFSLLEPRQALCYLPSRFHL